MMRLDHMRLAGSAAGGPEYIGVDRALRQPFDLVIRACAVFCLFFKNIDKQVTDG